MMTRKKAVAEASGNTLSTAIRQCVDAGNVEFGANRGTKRRSWGARK